MPSAKSGSAGAAVPPADSAAAQEADQADPGEVEKVKAQQRQTQSGKYGSAKTQPYKPQPNKESWIEIEMVDEQDQPVPGEAYRIELPDGSVAEGTLDEKGFARLDGIDPATCQISFPGLDKDAVEKL